MINWTELILAFLIGVMIASEYWRRRFNHVAKRVGEIGEAYRALSQKYLEATQNFSAEQLEKLEK